MSEYLSEAELIQKIKDLDAKIEASGDIDSYNYNSGMGSQQVKRRPISAMLALRKEYLNRLSNLRGEGVISIQMERGVL